MTIGQTINWIRSQGSKIDLWPKGSAGVEARWIIDGDTLYVLIYGTDSRFDWILHFLPGWGELAEILYGVALADQLALKIKWCWVVKKAIIYGHSWGGAIAPITADTLQNTFKGLQVCTVGLGAKMPAVSSLTYRFVHRGDIVPSLTPWRVWAMKRNRVPIGTKIVIGTRKPFWKAHPLGAYIHELWGVEWKEYVGGSYGEEREEASVSVRV